MTLVAVYIKVPTAAFPWPTAATTLNEYTTL